MLYLSQTQAPWDGEKSYADHFFCLDLSRESEAWLWEERRKEETRMCKYPGHAGLVLDSMAWNSVLSKGLEISMCEIIREQVRMQLCCSDTSQKGHRKVG